MTTRLNHLPSRLRGYAESMPPGALHGFLTQVPANGFSLWAAPLHADPEVVHDERREHYAASTMKLSLVIAAYRLADAGRLDLDQPIAVHDEFVSTTGTATFSIDRAEDSDPEPWRRVGSEVALRWLCHRAIVRSSNLATNIVLEHVGVEAVTETLAHVGATSSVVSRGIEDAPARAAGLDNVVTAADLGVTLQALAAGTAASTAACGEILAVLAAQQVNDAIPAGLPPGTRVAHKTGEVEGVSHNAGIVYPPDAPPYVLAICTTLPLPVADRMQLIAEAARASWDDRKVSE